MNTEFVFGGLGKVVDVFMREWSHSPIALCAPLYADAYEDDESTAPKFAKDPEPDMTFTVVVRQRLIPVDIFIVEGGDNPLASYIFIQSEVFRFRKRGTIYTFGCEREMLTWLSVLNQVLVFAS